MVWHFKVKTYNYKDGNWKVQMNTCFTRSVLVAIFYVALFASIYKAVSLSWSLLEGYLARQKTAKFIRSNICLLLKLLPLYVAILCDCWFHIHLMSLLAPVWFSKKWFVWLLTFIFNFFQQASSWVGSVTTCGAKSPRFKTMPCSLVLFFSKITWVQMFWNFDDGLIIHQTYVSYEIAHSWALNSRVQVL
jgi:hypothetical protein